MNPNPPQRVLSSFKFSACFALPTFLLVNTNHVICLDFYLVWGLQWLCATVEALKLVFIWSDVILILKVHDKILTELLDVFFRKTWITNANCFWLFYYRAYWKWLVGDPVIQPDVDDFIPGPLSKDDDNVDQLC